MSRSGVLSDGEAILGMVDPENLCGDAGLTSGEGLTGRVRSVCGVDVWGRCVRSVCEVGV